MEVVVTPSGQGADKHACDEGTAAMRRLRSCETQSHNRKRQDPNNSSSGGGGVGGARPTRRNWLPPFVLSDPPRRGCDFVQQEGIGALKVADVVVLGGAARALCYRSAVAWRKSKRFPDASARRPLPPVSALVDERTRAVELTALDRVAHVCRPGHVCRAGSRAPLGRDLRARDGVEGRGPVASRRGLRGRDKKLRVGGGLRRAAGAEAAREEPALVRPRATLGFDTSCGAERAERGDTQFG
ncbi:unnamed protein product [Lampetra fluviatilis]